MNWTKTPPTKPGGYRNREQGSECCWFIEVRRNQDGQLEGRPTVRTNWYPLNQFEGEWCGPLVPVEEVERAYREGWRDCLFSDTIIDGNYSTSRARKIVEGEV